MGVEGIEEGAGDLLRLLRCSLEATEVGVRSLNKRVGRLGVEGP